MPKEVPPTVEEVVALLPNADPEQVRKVLGLKRKAWPYRYRPTVQPEVLAGRLLQALQPGESEASAKTYRIAGRVRAKRGSGGIAFLVVEGERGHIQVILQKDRMGEAFDEALHLVTEGDFVGVEGTGMRSKRGEPSLGAAKVTLLAKAVAPFPDLRSADNPELRYGKPYIGLMQGPEVRRIVLQRARITQVLRQTLEKAGFIEAAIPVLEKVYGGANAKPFVTHSNAKDMPMYLRISHELALKKLLVGGLEKVYHIGPAFRNEDIDTTHNPEFTLMECYAAYWDYTDMMRLTAKAFQNAVRAVTGGPLVLKVGMHDIDFGSFRTVTMKDAIRQNGGPDPDTATDEEIQRLLDANQVVIRGGYSRGLAVAKLFEVFAEPALIQPTFVIDHPRETTPLCKPHRKDPTLVERFELFIAGREHANSYSELNDPYLQAKLFAEQESRRAGDEELPPTDKDFIDALTHAMPPAGGLGIGVDRMVMTILNVDSIKQVLPFPQVK